MNTTRHTYDEVMSYAYEQGIDLGFLSSAEIKYYETHIRELLLLILSKMESDY